MLLTTTESDVLTAAERLGDALTEKKTQSNDAEFSSILEEYNQELKQELGIDYGAICSDDSCC